MKNLCAFVLLLISFAVAHAQNAPTLPPPPPLVIPSPVPPPTPTPSRPVLTNDIIVRTPQQTPSQPNSPQTTSTVAPTPTPLPLAANEAVLIETEDGKTILQQAADEGFNPASAIKLATSLVALRTLGANYRFITGVYTNGQIDAGTGTLNGDLYISSRDFSFHDEHALMLARELNALGIRTVSGNLIVTPGFILNFSAASQRAAERLIQDFDSMQRPASAVRAWTEAQLAAQQTLARSSTFNPLSSPIMQPMPSVQIKGVARVDVVPPTAHLLLEQRSCTLAEILKVMLCYSNNFMAERLGDYLGGAWSVRSALVNNFGINPYDFQISSTSGLGYNRVTPRAMMQIFRALVAELAKDRLEPSAILSVAGIDPGTLERRFTNFTSRGSVIAKTGTLPHTSGGASALVGEFKTRDGKVYYFVIFNRGHNVWHSRALQDELITALQYERGGPAPFAYTPQTLALHLTDTEATAEGGDVNEKKQN